MRRDSCPHAALAGHPILRQALSGCPAAPDPGIHHHTLSIPPPSPDAGFSSGPLVPPSWGILCIAVCWLGMRNAPHTRVNIDILSAHIVFIKIESRADRFLMEPESVVQVLPAEQPVLPEVKISDRPGMVEHRALPLPYLRRNSLQQ